MTTIEQFISNIQSFEHGPEGPSWNGFTGALFRRGFAMETVYPDVKSAFRDSTILSLDAYAAPAGAIHWWNSSSGQCALDLEGAGKEILTAARDGLPGGSVIKNYAVDVVVLSFQSYNGIVVSPYMGWSLDYAGAKIETSSEETA